MPRRRDPLSDNGESLIELVIAVLILGVAAVAIVAGLALSIKVSDIHRKQATASADVRDFAETVTKAASANYAACAGTGAYSGYLPPGSYTAVITSVKYWNGTSFTATCAPDAGAQQVTLQVKSNDLRATETLVVVVRKCADGGACS